MKEHNDRVKSLKPYADFNRKAFFKEHLGDFRPFLETNVVEDLESFDPSGAPSPGMKPYKELMQQPSILNGDMRDYQLQGLNFLAKMHHAGTPCILGDEMGLGKTYQTISLICYLKENLQQVGPSLIVCPLSVLSSWENEFKKWAPSLKLTRFHTSEKYRKLEMENITKNVTKVDAILTTYDMLKAKGVATFFNRKQFRYVVLDEGHIIKNEETDAAQACRALKSYSKLILTGTPLQNNLHELWSLLNYLYPEYFVDSELFDNGFNIGANSVVDKSILLKCNVLLQRFMLRRLKAEVEKLMPKKLETHVQCPLSTMQVHWYKSLLMKDMSLLAKLQAQANGGDDESPSAGGSR